MERFPFSLCSASINTSDSLLTATSHPAAPSARTFRNGITATQLELAFLNPFNGIKIAPNLQASVGTLSTSLLQPILLPYLNHTTRPEALPLGYDSQSLNTFSLSINKNTLSLMSLVTTRNCVFERTYWFHKGKIISISAQGLQSQSVLSPACTRPSFHRTFTCSAMQFMCHVQHCT